MLSLIPLLLVGAAKALPHVVRMTGDFLKTTEGKTALKVGGTMLKDKDVTEPIKKSVKDAVEDMVDAHYTNNGWLIGSKDLEGIDTIDAGKYINVPIPHIITRLFRVYSLPSGATIEGMKNVIESYFHEKLNVSVSAISCDGGSYLIKAKTKIKLLAAWTDFEVEIFLSKGDSCVEVSYLEGTNNLENTLNAAFFDNPLVGLCKIFGVASRRDIPLAINENVRAYLEEYRKAEAEKKWKEYSDGHRESDEKWEAWFKFHSK